MKQPPYSVQLLDDPNLPPEVLAHIAATHPELWDAILLHQQCYPALGEWIVNQRATPQRSAQQSQPMPADVWASEFQSKYGREATMREYQEAVAAGETVAPETPTHTLGEGVQTMPLQYLKGVNRWIARAPKLVFAAGFLAVLSLLTSLWSAEDISADLLSPENVSRSSFHALTMLVVAECAILITVVKRRWAVVCTGVFALILGSSAVVDGLILPWAGAGVSIWLGGIGLGASGLVMVAGGMLILQSLRERFVSLYPRPTST
ncbi:hypothetical protein [Leucobacter sp. L43]|uniref:variant leucine-rich repeat-containing protein n=1 Tax=Leucobacter sp. L43 TaxID=2798040 RepID=UPI001F1BF073|nr:hypothetical protein [Leucobacter sp. L43]